MTGQVKVTTHTVVDFLLCDRSEVFAHSITQGSFAVANILFTTFFALYAVYNVVGFTAATSDGVVAVFGNRASNSPRAVEAETVSAVRSLTPAFLRVGYVFGVFKDNIHGVGAPGPDQVVSYIFGSAKTLSNFPFKDSASAAGTI